MRNSVWMMDPISNADYEVQGATICAIVEFAVNEGIPGADANESHQEKAQGENSKASKCSDEATVHTPN